MDYIKWDEKLSVGVKLFDDEHKKLIALVNDLNQFIMAGSKETAIDNALAGLIDYTRKHFKDEEEMMVKYKYLSYVKHKNEHDVLTAKVVDFHKRLNEGKANFSLELIKFLQDWLVNHIKGTDMQYRQFFTDKGVS